MFACEFFLPAAFSTAIYQLLAKLEGKEAVKAAKAALRSPATGGHNNSISTSSVAAAEAAATNPRYMTQEEATREQSLTKNTLRLRQLQLQGTCAKLILACVRHRCVVRRRSSVLV